MILTTLQLVLIASFLITLFSQLVYFLTVDQNYINSKKEEMKKLQSELKKMKVSDPEYIKIQNQLISINLDVMNKTMKPTLITFVPFIIIMSYLSNIFKETGKLITFPFSIPILGTGLGWLGTFILSSLIFSLIMNKILSKIFVKR
ncbi:MAG: EMC3/TMCO1 family protein [Candidatus Parvarchaeota archaeon]|nr:EMC3/TMCO1 family protein [Candidatus Jingweiarchaeum tengchongense]MCW1297780.1 EMC3/TMCO1 family protein [Candidatus Jingweiarchaeum tengchongense]MCW1299790.1 EMC3/TMCO1 family protein [Candidatus Jingweiarchaeum tengchongense]MCW1304239.1 EMC3/TMCO1 family protein [Candidatus Jingweiarchaeum tengchongense]MCW1305267.1 EMC3/TMCO1 family protein [Candidatus Jingweiarchaeum tengchongense]